MGEMPDREAAASRGGVHCDGIESESGDAAQPGDWVMAIGNPFNLGHTVTVGVVSYLGRPFQTSEGRFQKMIQADASINPGNSGGPLIDTDGRIGLQVSPIGEDEAQALRLTKPQGAIVRQVERDSPADRAGIAPEDE